MVDADDYLVQVSRYIHLNPVKAKLCEQPYAFEWSSYRAYIDRENKTPWLHTNEVLRKVSTIDACKHYAALVENPLTLRSIISLSMAGQAPCLAAGNLGGTC